MSDEAPSLIGIQELVRTKIEEQFATGRERVFLSTLGSDLGEYKAHAERLSGLRFGDFIERHLDYPVGRMGEHKNILFVVPAGASTETSAEVGPRFAPSLWTAFARPLEGGEQRFINLATLRFGASRGEVCRLNDDVREIDSRFISTAENSRNVADIIRRVSEWLTEQNLEQERFLLRKQKRETTSRTALSALIENLSVDQLRRTMLPLDVVKTLLQGS